MKQTLLIIGSIWPEPVSSAAGLRDLALIDLFQRGGWQVVYAAPSKENEFSEALVKRGLSIRTVSPNDPSFDEWIRRLQPACVVFDRFVIEEQFGWRVSENCPNALRVLDTIDLHFLRRARMAALETSTPLNLKTEDAVREVASIYRSDLTLLVSDFEQKLLHAEFGVPMDLLAVHRWPYSTPDRNFPGPEYGGFEERSGFVMIGNFRHPPNRDGTLWLKEKIWPLIREKMPAAEVHVFGAYPPKDIMALDDAATGFRVKGWARDQYETLGRYRVNLAPLRFGAGIKGKISDGWSTGTPVVTTPIGAEGMHGGLSWPGGEGLIAETERQFAEAATALHTEKNLWSSARDQGFEILRNLYHPDTQAAELLPRMDQALREIQERRARNFTGMMLQHHLHKSTTWFSRWIELKNQLKESQGKGGI